MKRTIHDLPKIERPREKLIKYGPEKLSNPELLAILIRTGRKGFNALDISKNFFKEFSVEESIQLSYSELSKVKGFGSVKACEVIAAIELGKRLLQNKQNIILLSPKEVWGYCSDFRSSMKEHFVTLYLDSRQQKIAKELISIGTLNASLVHPREVFEPAIIHHAAGIIMVHNHPSNNCEPSDADLEITKKLVNVGKLLDIEVIDHVIVTKDQWYSFKEKDLL